jgi:hypothetical protein
MIQPSVAPFSLQHSVTSTIRLLLEMLPKSTLSDASCESLTLMLHLYSPKKIAETANNGDVPPSAPLCTKVVPVE